MIAIIVAIPTVVIFFRSEEVIVVRRRQRRRPILNLNHPHAGKIAEGQGLGVDGLMLLQEQNPTWIVRLRRF